MIEIIREEDWDHTAEKKALPKDIKQIGRPDIGDRIYVENQVYQFLHPYESQDEKTAYVLMGRFENYAGRQCTFVEAAIRLEEMNFEGELPLWNDQTWAYIYKQLKKEYESMVIVGWAMDIKGQLPNMTVRIEGMHQNNFGGVHQVLFLMDTLEKEETFYGSRNGHLYRREGFYIYYDKHIPEQLNSAMQELMEEQDEEDKEDLPLEEHPVFLEGQIFQEETIFEEEQNGTEEAETERIEGHIFSEEEPIRQGMYRKQAAEKEEKHQAPSYAYSLLLAVVVCVLGVTAFQNYQKMNAMENTLAQMKGDQPAAAAEQKKETESEEVKIESVMGNVNKQDQGAAGEKTKSEGSGDMPEEVNNASQSGTATDAVSADAQDLAEGEKKEQNSEETTEIGEDQDTKRAKNDMAQDAAKTEENKSVKTEVQTYLEQGYYIVQKGDNLAGICRKIYQTTAVMDKLCEVNKIEDKDAIFAGQYLTLPN